MNHVGGLDKKKKISGWIAFFVWKGCYSYISLKRQWFLVLYRFYQLYYDTVF